MKKKRNNNKKPSGFNLLMLVISVLASAAAGVGCYSIYDMLLGKVPSVVLVPMVLALFMLIMGLVVMLSSVVFGFFRANVLTGKNADGKVFLYLLAGGILCFLIMMPLELIYEADFSKEDPFNASSYIFAVDDSGSMYSSDPNNIRYDAIEAILSKKPADNQFMVYAFADDVKTVVPMQTVGQGVPQLQAEQNGGTMMGVALERIISDYEQGIWTASGDVMVVLITDGYASDLSNNRELDQLLQRFVDKNIAVSAVGLGTVDKAMLNRIAGKTGGSFVDIRRATDLYNAVEVAARVGERDLLSVRAEIMHSILLGILRVLFITVYGVLFSLMMVICYGDNRSFKLIMISGSIKAFLAALVLELGLNTLYMDEVVACVTALIFIGALICKYFNPYASESEYDNRGEIKDEDVFADSTGELFL